MERLPNDRDNYEVNQENVIEFLRNSSVASATFTQGKYISKMKKLAEQYPNECKVVVENEDGSIVVHFPTKWIKISNRSRDLSDEQRQALADRLRNSRNS